MAKMGFYSVIDFDNEVREQIEIKPCPFCGGEGEIVYNNGYYPTCFNKGCVMYNAHDPFLIFETQQLAVKAWNIRSEIKPLNT